MADLDGKHGVHVYYYSAKWAQAGPDASEGKTLPTKRQLFAWVDAVVAGLAKTDKIVPVPDSREEIEADTKLGKSKQANRWTKERITGKPTKLTN